MKIVNGLLDWPARNIVVKRDDNDRNTYHLYNRYTNLRICVVDADLQTVRFVSDDSLSIIDLPAIVKIARNLKKYV
jgi:hypothetical protein